MPCYLCCDDRVKGRDTYCTVIVSLSIPHPSDSPIRAEGHSPLFERTRKCSESKQLVFIISVYISNNMVDKNDLRSVAADGLEALKLVCNPALKVAGTSKADNLQVARLSWRRNFTAWFYIPAGILFVLLACFGVNSLIGLSSVSFPASVACLIALFLALIFLDMIIGDRKTRAVVNIIDVPVSLLLF